ncbi:hypothetical protein CIB84_008402 [Bambusicola thoracicus]|uniref:Uncharacterized protein n=1 Tax=Bambusicola thoracicus TaxID=9083 RepID=A0A2P4SUQ7_BAMTH|nr:hypothetical protein CIB84_008402 [Bambusicola thoracicus]
MPQERTLRLQPGSRIYALCVLGTHIATDVYRAAPAGAVAFGVKHTEGVNVEVAFQGQAEPGLLPGVSHWPLNEGTVLRFSMSRASAEVNDNKVIVIFYAEGGQPIDQARVFLTGIGISLDVDADRDGVVEKNNPNKASWTWGPEGHGAILLVTCDRDSPLSPAPDCDEERVFSKEDLLDMSRMVLRIEGPQHLPRGYEIVLYVHMSDADKVGVFHMQMVFRVAPWIMMPNTLTPENVFVCSVKDNYLYIKEIKNLVNKAGCDLKVCFGYINRGDRWMQDEIEFGYTQAPHKSFAVVLDSPQDTGLEQFPIKELLQVQAPVELFSDWLATGHVNEFVTFVPSPDAKRFRMLMASPAACYKLFRQKQKEGQGEATMFKGKRAVGSLGGNCANPSQGYSGTDTKRVTINKVLSNGIMMQQNQYVQRCIDWNRDILKKELGLTEEDIIDLPALFKLDKGKAMPYFPNMVPMLILSKELGIPKPFGPLVGGECCLEHHVRSLLEPLGLRCRFLEDISSYHGRLGEVHCGTNVHRRPFAFCWWHVMP